MTRRFRFRPPSVAARRAVRGQALVELALVLPLFLLVVLGVFDLGRAIYAANTINNAARDAARVAIVDQRVARVEQEARDLAVGVAVTVQVRFHASKPNADPSTNPACDPSVPRWAEVALSCIAIVDVQHAYAPVVPMIEALVGQITLSASTEMPIERGYVSP